MEFEGIRERKKIQNQQNHPKVQTLKLCKDPVHVLRIPNSCLEGSWRDVSNWSKDVFHVFLCFGMFFYINMLQMQNLQIIMRSYPRVPTGTKSAWPSAQKCPTLPFRICIFAGNQSHRWFQHVKGPPILTDVQGKAHHVGDQPCNHQKRPKDPYVDWRNLCHDDIMTSDRVRRNVGVISTWNLVLFSAASWHASGDHSCNIPWVFIRKSHQI